MTKNLEPSKAVLDKVAKALKHKEPRPGTYTPSSDDPREELRVLVTEHVGIAKRRQTIENLTTDRKFKDGTVRKCPLPPTISADLQAPMKAMDARCDKLTRMMANKRNLGRVPVYTEFLEKVFGCGPLVAAYLVVLCDFTRCEKPSALQRRCGNGNQRRDDGRANLEKPGHGSTKDERKIHFRPELRVRIWQMFGAMWKNAAKLAVTTKYLGIWQDYKNRMAHSPRRFENYIDLDWQEHKAADALRAGTASVKKRKTAKGGTIMAVVDNETGATVGEVRSFKAFIHAAGRRKATDVFLEDFYIMGRTLEGLPVWPSWYADKLGYRHGGKIEVGGPKMLTLDEARELVGDVGAIPTSEPVEDAGDGEKD